MCLYTDPDTRTQEVAELRPPAPIFWPDCTDGPRYRLTAYTAFLTVSSIRSNRHRPVILSSDIFGRRERTMTDAHLKILRNHTPLSLKHMGLGIAGTGDSKQR